MAYVVVHESGGDWVISRIEVVGDISREPGMMNRIMDEIGVKPKRSQGAGPGGGGRDSRLGSDRRHSHQRRRAHRKTSVR